VRVELLHVAIVYVGIMLMQTRSYAQLYNWANDRCRRMLSTLPNSLWQRYV